MINTASCWISIMRKIKAIILISVGFLLAYFGYAIFLPQVDLDKRVLEVALSRTVSVVGFRDNTGNATVPYRYNFYVQTEGAKISTPFMVTDTPDVHIAATGQYAFDIIVTGKVYQFTNVVWITENDELLPLNITMNASHSTVPIKINQQPIP